MLMLSMRKVRCVMRRSIAPWLVSCWLFACSDTQPVPTSQMTAPSMTTAGASAPVPASAAGATAGSAAGTPAIAVAGRSAATGNAAGAAAGVPAIAGRSAPDDLDAGVIEPVDAAVTTAPDAATTPPPTREDLSKGDGSDVITIGDSWMNLGSTGIQQSLLKASGQRYRTFGRPGTRLVNDVIPNQYESAKRADPDIKTVVMTGGGNDIIQVPGLRDDCDAGGMMCAMVLGQILDRLTELWDEMAADGVQDVLYVQYSNPEGKNVDFALPNGDGVKKRCEATKAPLRCHRLETLDIVMGDIPDGIHPSAVAFDRVGKAVFERMTQEGMRR